MGIIYSKPEDDLTNGCDIRITVDCELGLAKLEMAGEFGEAQLIISSDENPELFAWIYEGEKVLQGAGGRKAKLDFEKH